MNKSAIYSTFRLFRFAYRSNLPEKCSLSFDFPALSISFQKLSAILLRKPATFVCGWSQETTRRRCPMHEHEVMELVYHPSGEGITCLGDGKKIFYSDRSVVLYSARVPHDQAPTRPGSDVCIHLNVPPKVARLLPPADCFTDLSDPSIGEEFWSLSRAIPISGSPTSCIFDLRVTALLLRICAISDSEIRISDPQKVFVQNARQFMQENFASIDSVAEVAQSTGVSEDYLRHLFQRLEGISMTQYLARLRLDRAKDLLRHSRLPLKAIASQCGFKTERYFCTRFLAYTGLSPGAFRKRPGGPRPPDL
jgi:AraC-like DNA-binding protein